MIAMTLVLLVLLIFELCHSQNKEAEYTGQISSLQLKTKEQEQIIINLKKDIRRIENKNTDVEI